jgi:hypothetical protein
MYTLTLALSHRGRGMIQRKEPSGMLNQQDLITLFFTLF